MGRRTHGRASREPGQARPGDAAPRHDPASALLALQQSGGNRAVGALLARAPSADPKTTEQPTGTARVTLGGIGTIPVESIRFPVSRHPGGTGPGGRHAERAMGGEVQITSTAGAHSPLLNRAATESTTMNGRVDFADPAVHVLLTNAILSGYHASTSQGRHDESWTLDVESIVFVTRQPGGGDT